MFKIKKKRYQCKNCFKTFHKPGKAGHMIGSEVIEFDVCPHCSGDYIQV